MLTKELVASELIRVVESAEEGLKSKRTWCEQCMKLEAQTGKDFLKSRWNICGTIEVDKKYLTELRKTVGRLKMTSKSVVTHNGEDRIRVMLRPMSKDWDHLRFAYETKYRPGKCRIINQSYSYKTLVCDK